MVRSIEELKKMKSSCFDFDSTSSDYDDPSEYEIIEIETFESSDFTLNKHQYKEGTDETSDSNHHNSHSNSECEREISDI